MKLNRRSLGIGVLLVSLLASCGGNTAKKLATPDGFTFDKATGSYQFNTVENGDLYQIVMQRRINEDTYKSLKANDRTSSMVTTYSVGDGDAKETWYVWNENITSANSLSDRKGRGYIKGSFDLRTYSNSASSAGTAVEFNTLQPGEYIILWSANATDEYEESDNGQYTFTQAGTLTAPSVTYSISADGKITGNITNNDLYNCLTSTGLPTSIDFSLKVGDTVKETKTMTDFSWTCSINGPTNSFTFNNLTFTLDNTYTTADFENSSLVVTAKSDKSEIKAGESQATAQNSLSDFSIKTIDTTAASFEFTGVINGTTHTFVATKSISEDPECKYYAIVTEKDNPTSKWAGNLFVGTVVSMNSSNQEERKDLCKLTLGTASLSGNYQMDGTTITVDNLA